MGKVHVLGVLEFTSMVLLVLVDDGDDNYDNANVARYFLLIKRHFFWGKKKKKTPGFSTLTMRDGIGILTCE